MLFNFINCETFFVSESYSDGIDFVIVNNDLPFERDSFDIVINFSNLNNFSNFLKKDGFLLTKSNCCEIFYELNETNFTVLKKV